MQNEVVTPTDAANIAIELIRTAKRSMIENGADEHMIYAVSRKLSAILELPVDMVLDIMAAIKC